MRNALPVLYTHRLLLRVLTGPDIPSLVRYVNNPNISCRILNFPYPYTEYHAIQRITQAHSGIADKTRYNLAIVFRDIEPEEVIGEVSLYIDKQQNIAQLAYWVAEPFWNQGIASEAVAAILRFGFEKLSLTSIFAECVSDNIASEKVMIRNHMVKQGQNNTIIKYLISNSNT